MLPFEDSPRREQGRFPFVMLAVLLTNVAVFLYELTLSQSDLERFLLDYGAIPAIISGAMPSVQPSPIPPYLTIITAMFIHGGFLHIIVNMVFLWVFGDNVEASLGHFTFLVFYFVAGIFATLTQVLAFPTSIVPTIGASGAIAGVLGAYLVLFPRAQVRVLLFFGPFFALDRVAALIILFGWFVLQVFRGVGSLSPIAVPAGGVAYLAHVGGFVVGVLMTVAIRRLRDQPLGSFRGRFRWSCTIRTQSTDSVARW